MASTFLRFGVAFVVVGGLYLALCAQEPIESRDGKGEAKEIKAKLFEGPAFGGKMSKGASGGVLDALRDKKVQEEIGLLPLQLEELLRLNEQVAKELGPIVDDFNKLTKAEQDARSEAMRKDLLYYLKGVQTDIDKILLPEQLQRLRQVAFQMRMQKSGSVETIVSPDVLRELGMDDLQAERLRESLEKIEEEHRNKIIDLEIEKERKILALFTPTQQNKLKSMIGPMMRSLSKTSGNPKASKP